jgi:hypothetical protein
MYGIINKSIKDLVVYNFGVEKWNLIRERSGIEQDFFISSESYDDEITWQIANNVAVETGMSVTDVLITFGEWWVLKTTKEKYASLMDAGGSNLKEFICNLPVFHNRIMLIYPKLAPPEFKITDNTNDSLNLHYLSSREGLQDFVRGLLQGLSKMFDEKISIELLQTRDDGNSHEIFKITWL